MRHFDIPVAGGELHAVHFGDSERIVLAAHGITATALAWQAVARALPEGWGLVAVDLRGRGGSADLPGPWGMTRHAEDLISVAGGVDTKEKVVLTGHSMGAYAALRAAALSPGSFSHLVLVDGGLPLPRPAKFDSDRLLEFTVGPAITRLKQTFPSVESYVDFFRAHPALSGNWTEDVADYARYDTKGPEGEVRSRANAEAVYADGRDLLVNADSFGDDLARLAIPAHLLYCEKGLMGQPPGMLLKPIVQSFAASTPLTVELVPEVNHYTVLFDQAAAKIVADRLTA